MKVWEPPAIRSDSLPLDERVHNGNPHTNVSQPHCCVIDSGQSLDSVVVYMTNIQFMKSNKYFPCTTTGTFQTRVGFGYFVITSVGVSLVYNSYT